MEAHREAGVDRREHDVEPPVALEIVDERPAGEPRRVEAALLRDVDEEAGVVGRLQRRFRDHEGLRHAGRVRAERHVRQVEQPAHLEVVGTRGEEALEMLDRLGRARLELVLSRLAEREQAAVGVRVLQAVLNLAAPQLGDAEDRLEIALGVRQRRIARAVLDRDPQRLREVPDRIGHLSPVGVDLPEIVVGAHELVRPAGLLLDRSELCSSGLERELLRFAARLAEPAQAA